MRVLSGVVYKTKRRRPRQNLEEHHKSRYERKRESIFTFDAKTTLRQVT